MSVNSRLKATKIRGQKKAFHRQKIPEYSCARKETVDIDILVTHYSLCFFTGRWWTKRDGEEIIIFSNKIRIFVESPCFLSESKSKYEGKTVFFVLCEFLFKNLRRNSVRSWPGSKSCKHLNSDDIRSFWKRWKKCWGMNNSI